MGRIKHIATTTIIWIAKIWITVRLVRIACSGIKKSKRCRQAFDCTKQLCQFTHSKAWSDKRKHQNLPEARSLSTQIITEEDQNLDRVTKEAHKAVNSPTNSLNMVTKEAHEAVNSPTNSLNMVVVPLKKNGKNKTYCHYYNNLDRNNLDCCLFGENCLFRHRKSKRCRQALDFTRQLCQFTHSKAWSFKRKDQNLPEARSLSVRVITTTIIWIAIIWITVRLV